MTILCSFLFWLQSFSSKKIKLIGKKLNFLSCVLLIVSKVFHSIFCQSDHCALVIGAKVTQISQWMNFRRFTSEKWQFFSWLLQIQAHIFLLFVQKSWLCNFCFKIARFSMIVKQKLIPTWNLGRGSANVVEVEWDSARARRQGPYSS